MKRGQWKPKKTWNKLKRKSVVKKVQSKEVRYIKSLPKKLEKISHDYIRKRDSIQLYDKKGYCCCCKKLQEGQHFQAGHYIPSSTGGVLLRYHPQNMHGQCSGCNMFYRQEEVKTQYADFMYQKYGAEKIKRLRELQRINAQRDKFFFESMIELYKTGNEEEIIKFLESYL